MVLHYGEFKMMFGLKKAETNVITINVIWVSLKTESFVYRWLHAHAPLDITCFSTFVGASNIISCVLSIQPAVCTQGGMGGHAAWQPAQLCQHGQGHPAPTADGRPQRVHGVHEATIWDETPGLNSELWHLSLFGWPKLLVSMLNFGIYPY